MTDLTIHNSHPSHWKKGLSLTYQNPPTRAYSTGWGSRQDTATSKWVLFTSRNHLQIYWKKNNKQNKL